jgi:hypothetical protein
MPIKFLFSLFMIAAVYIAGCAKGGSLKSSKDCTPGDPSSCDDGIDCTIDGCKEENGKTECAHVPDDDLCKKEEGEICDPKKGCVPGGEVPVDCKKDSDCDNGIFCDGDEKCVDGECKEGGGRDCSDNIDCTIDDCVGQEKKCIHTPDHTICSDGQICDLKKGCIEKPCETNEDCDNGLYCDGKEICGTNKKCKPGERIKCPDDGINCTLEYCDEDEDEKKCKTSVEDVRCRHTHECVQGKCIPDKGGCVYTPDDEKCQNGDLCDGKEICDIEQGCIPGEEVRCPPKPEECLVGACNPATGECEYEIEKEICNDQKDNDCDNKTDGADPDCEGKLPACQMPQGKITASGTFSGNTSKARNDYGQRCQSFSHGRNAPEHVWIIELQETKLVRIYSSAPYNEFIYLRRKCDDPSTLVACDHKDHRIEKILSGGTYYLFVDGKYRRDKGEYTLNVKIEPLPCDKYTISTKDPSYPDYCGDTSSSANVNQPEKIGDCKYFADGKGTEDIWKVPLSNNAILDVTLTASYSNPLLYIREICTSSPSQKGCDKGSPYRIITEFYSGSGYKGNAYIFVDGNNSYSNKGEYCLQVYIRPHYCDVPPQRVITASGSYTGDTTGSYDFTKGNCMNSLVDNTHLERPEEVWKLTLNQSKRVTITLETEIRSPSLYIRGSCYHRSSEKVCDDFGSISITRTLDKGDYFIFVDSDYYNGSKGEYTLTVDIK